MQKWTIKQYPAEWHAYAGISFQSDTTEYRSGARQEPGHYSKELGEILCFGSNPGKSVLMWLYTFMIKVKKAIKLTFKWSIITIIFDYVFTHKNSERLNSRTKIQVIIYHDPQWDEDSYKHDIALFKLSTPIPSYSEYLMPVCIPNSYIKDQITPEIELKVSGFGDTGKVHSIICAQISTVNS